MQNTFIRHLSEDIRRQLLWVVNDDPIVGDAFAVHSTGESVFKRLQYEEPKNLSLMLLARPIPRMDMELHSSIYEEHFVKLIL